MLYIILECRGGKKRKVGYLWDGHICLDHLSLFATNQYADQWLGGKDQALETQFVASLWDIWVSLGRLPVQGH